MSGEHARCERAAIRRSVGRWLACCCCCCRCHCSGQGHGRSEQTGALESCAWCPTVVTIRWRPCHHQHRLQLRPRLQHQHRRRLDAHCEHAVLSDCSASCRPETWPSPGSPKEQAQRGWSQSERRWCWFVWTLGAQQLRRWGRCGCEGGYAPLARCHRRTRRRAHAEGAQLPSAPARRFHSPSLFVLQHGHPPGCRYCQCGERPSSWAWIGRPWGVAATPSQAWSW